MGLISQPLSPVAAGTCVALASDRKSCRIQLARTKKVVAHERIFTPSAGSHLSHNLVSAQIQTAKQQRRRTDATVLRVDWKETRLTIPA